MNNRKLGKCKGNRLYDSVGGTWYENTYPGCGVDTPNHVYAYSFEPSFHWKEFYSKRDAIYKYLKKCVKKYDLD